MAAAAIAMGVRRRTLTHGGVFMTWDDPDCQHRYEEYIHQRFNYWIGAFPRSHRMKIYSELPGLSMSIALRACHNLVRI